jgi:hypothetical protein
MKRIIRWLADVSGVTTEIKTEQIRETGGRLNQDHYWWTGGLMYPKGRNNYLLNAFFLYGDHMKKYGTHPDIQRIRDEVMKLKDHYINDVK